jgi:tRNA-dihydrouridine synthase B
MAGYTDAAFREICAGFGASMCFTEMVSAEGLARGSRKTEALLRRAPNEKLIGFQIFAGAPMQAAAAVGLIARLAPTVIDLNCGCSVPKVLKTGCGAALLRKPEAIRDIVSAMRQATGVPISVKIRSGWDETSRNFREVAEAAVRGGASMVTLHPRTRAQGFSGAALWEEIGVLARSLPVPVLGSGDLFHAEDVRRMLESTRCAGVMLARGAVGNPFLFREAAALLADGRTIPPPETGERLSTAYRHLALMASQVGERLACREMRKHCVAYTRGVPGAAGVRQAIIHADSLAEYRGLFAAYLGVSSFPAASH